MSWNALAGALGGAKGAFANHLARQQQDVENSQRDDQLALEQRRIEAAIAADQAQTDIARQTLDYSKFKDERTAGLDTLGGLTGSVANSPHLQQLANRFAPHLVEQREARLPSSNYGAMMGGGQMVQTGQDAGEAGGTYVNPYISEGMKSTLATLDNRQELASQRNLFEMQRFTEKQQDAREQFSQRYELQRQTMEANILRLQAAAQAATSAADGAAARLALQKETAKLEAAERRAQVIGEAMTEAYRLIDPSKDPNLMTKTPEEIEALRQAYTQKKLSTMGAQPAAQNWRSLNGQVGGAVGAGPNGASGSNNDPLNLNSR